MFKEVKQKMSEGLEGAKEQVWSNITNINAFTPIAIVSKVFCLVKINAMNHHANIMQATYIWGAAMEKVVEGKESAAEKATLLKEATVEKVTFLKDTAVEKVNSVKENVGDAITFESESPVRESDAFSDAPVDNPDNNDKLDDILCDPDGDHDDDLAGGDLAWSWLL